MKAQVSVEMLIVVGIGVALVSIYVLHSYNLFYYYKTNMDTTIAEDSLEKIAKNAEFVSYQGEPARQKINICLPSGVENCSILNNNKTLSCNLTDKTVFYDSEVNLNGTLPQSSGCWDLILSSKNNFVEIEIE